MIILLTIIHVLVCFFLVVVVLLQSGKAADLAGAFGGMGSQTAFGPRGAATILTKATTIAAGLFMLTSLVLSINASRMGKTGSTVLEGVAPKQTQQKGATGQQPVQLPVPVSTEAGQTTTSPVPAPPAAPAGKQPGGTPATPPAEPAKK